LTILTVAVINAAAAPNAVETIITGCQLFPLCFQSLGLRTQPRGLGFDLCNLDGVA